MDVPLKIAIASNRLDAFGGGVAAVALKHASLLTKRGHEVTVLGEFNEDTPLPKGVSSIRLKHSPAKFLFPSSYRMDSSFEKLDILHLHGLWTPLSVLTRRMAFGRRVKTVISPHGMLDSWALQNSGIKKRIASAFIEKSNLSAATAIHALNEAEESSIRAYIQDQRTYCIPNGVDQPTWKSALPDVLNTESRKKLLYLGRIHPKKGVKELIEGWGLLTQQNQALRNEWCLAIAGWDDGGHIGDCKKLVSALEISDDVHFLGPVFGDEKESVLANCSAFVLPSYSEGLPMSVLEAWSHGLPVFMTNECNIPHAFASDAAIRITPSPQNLAEKFKLHLPDPDLNRFGVNGRSLALADYSWKKVTDQLEVMYRQALVT